MLDSRVGPLEFWQLSQIQERLLPVCELVSTGGGAQSSVE
jgi:hypothetical protein